MANEENLIPFKPGQSGNPAGRPKGSKNLSTNLREMLEVEIDTLDPVKKIQVKKKIGDVLNLKLIQSALQGNLSALKEIYDRIEGKAKEHVEIETPGDQKITVEFVETSIEELKERQKENANNGDEGSEEKPRIDDKDNGQ